MTLEADARFEIYRHWVGAGDPPLPTDLARALGCRTHTVETLLARLADAHSIVLAPGTPYIWLANPLCALRSPYRVDARGRQWWGICIWDALGILAMLHSDGSVATACPDCGEELTVTVSDGEVSETDNVVHYAVAASRWWEDIGFT